MEMASPVHIVAMHPSRWLKSSLLGLGLVFISSPAFAQVSISLYVAPPPLVVEDQPPVPDDGDIWTPGYWAYDQDQGAYYWVSGAWVQPPEPDLYWTPSYWAWNGNDYVYNPGYWGPTVGFYGGVNYGYGYWGNGYGGGRWDNGHFNYNTAANNVSGGRVHNTYADNAAVRPQSDRVSFNGGRGGIQAQPTVQERQASQGNHTQATAQQQARYQSAAQSRSHEVKVNAKTPAPATATANPVKPAGSSQFTGEAPGQHQPPYSPGNQPKPEQKPIEPATATQSASSSQSPFTGEPAPGPRREDTATTAPGQHEHADSPDNQPRPEEKPAMTHVEQPAPNQFKPEEKPASPIEHTAPAELSHTSQAPAPALTHTSQAPAPEVKHEQAAAAPQSHPQAAPAAAKPQGNPQAKEAPAAH